jgi:hypothetical protein
MMNGAGTVVAGPVLSTELERMFIRLVTSA